VDEEKVVREKENLCGVVTLYYPTYLHVKNLETYAHFLQKLIVVDNSPHPDYGLHQKLLEYVPHAEIIAPCENLGVAAALNIGAEMALSGGFSWLLTMDQDSFFPEDVACRFFDAFKLLETATVAVLAPGHNTTLDDGTAGRFEPKFEVMTAGSLVNLNLIPEIGLFDERLFIDAVDHDFCIRAGINGYAVLEAVNCCMGHQPGELYNGSCLWGRKKKVFSIHSPKRMYFIVRNSLYLIHTYKSFNKDDIRVLRRHMHARISRCLRYSSRRFEYARFILKAYVDFFFCRYGNSVDI